MKTHVFPKPLMWWFNKYKFDALLISTDAPGMSAYNQVEQRMAPLSKTLTGLLLPYDHFNSDKILMVPLFLPLAIVIQMEIQAKSTNHYADLWKCIAINKLVPLNEHQILPYDMYSPTLKSKVKQSLQCMWHLLPKYQSFEASQSRRL